MKRRSGEKEEDRAQLLTLGFRGLRQRSSDELNRDHFAGHLLGCSVSSHLCSLQTDKQVFISSVCHQQDMSRPATNPARGLSAMLLLPMGIYADLLQDAYGTSKQSQWMLSSSIMQMHHVPWRMNSGMAR